MPWQWQPRNRPKTRKGPKNKLLYVERQRLKRRIGLLLHFEGNGLNAGSAYSYILKDNGLNTGSTYSYILKGNGLNAGLAYSYILKGNSFKGNGLNAGSA